MSAWDEEERTHREDYESPRSYISAVSEKIEDPPETCEGHAKNDVGESRMDSESVAVESVAGARPSGLLDRPGFVFLAGHRRTVT